MTGWNLPPGVSESDLPGNRPEDLATDDMGESEAAFYAKVLSYYGRTSHQAKAFRVAFVQTDAGNEEWLCNLDVEAEAEEIVRRVADNEAAIHEASYTEDDCESGPVKVPEAEWPEWARKAKQENAALNERLRALCDHAAVHKQGHLHEEWTHKDWCPDGFMTRPGTEHASGEEETT